MDEYRSIKLYTCITCKKGFPSCQNGAPPNDHSECISCFNKQMSITTDPDIVSGMPVIKGTRIQISLVVACLKDGMTIQEICDDYNLKSEQVISALNYVINLLDKPFLEE